MLFAVIREIEALRRDCHVFQRLEEATAYYEHAAYVCMEGPDDGDDPTIVTNCWLYSADLPDEQLMRESALSGQTNLLSVCFPPAET